MYSDSTCNDASFTVPQCRSDPSSGSVASSLDEPEQLRRQAVSPSLRPRLPGDSPAFELKFLLDEARAREVAARLSRDLMPDPHSDPELGDAYRITSIYCDTPGLEVFHRIGSHRRRKYRLRRYGNESLIFLERKTKRGDRVRKRRVTINDRELPALSAFSTDPAWPGHWFHKQLVRRALEPVCAVQYVRTAYVGTGDEGPLRLTFDRDLRACLVNDWGPTASCDGNPVLTGQVVCEFKFHGNLPALFKGVIQELALEPARVSKYRQCLRAAGGGTKGSPGDG